MLWLDLLEERLGDLKLYHDDSCREKYNRYNLGFILENVVWN